MYGDPAWDEYMSTGIDPTGGDLGPDFDPETGEYLDEENQEAYIQPSDGLDPVENYLDGIIAKLERMQKSK